MLDAQTLNIDEQQQPLLGGNIKRYGDEIQFGQQDQYVGDKRFCWPSVSKVSLATLLLVATVIVISASLRFRVSPIDTLQTLGSFHTSSQPHHDEPGSNAAHEIAAYLHHPDFRSPDNAAPDVSEDITLQQYLTTSTRAGDEMSTLRTSKGEVEGGNPLVASLAQQRVDDAPTTTESFAYTSTTTTSLSTTDRGSSGASSTSIFLIICAGLAGLLLLTCIICAIVRRQSENSNNWINHCPNSFAKLWRKENNDIIVQELAHAPDDAHFEPHMESRRKVNSVTDAQLAAHHGGSEGVDALMAVLRREAFASEPEPPSRRCDNEGEDENSMQLTKSPRQPNAKGFGMTATAEEKAAGSSESDSDVFQVFD